VTDSALLALGAAASFAVLNWLAVAKANKPLEYAAKPATMLALIVVAATIDPTSEVQRFTFVAALAFSLVGDIFLMLPGDRFIGGVAGFLVAHLAYIVGFRVVEASPIGLAIGAVVVVVFVATIGIRILNAVKEADEKLVTPVSAYVAVISVMVASAVSTRNLLAIFGAMTFMASDTLIAWNRFVQKLPWAPVTIMVTYHAGQAMLVLSLLR
jgi:uncharacterized membrane protein YhhN